MRLFIRVAGIILIVITVIWWYVKPDFDPLYNFVAALITLMGSFVNLEQKAAGETLDQRNRRVMLNHVENFWIKGILEKSLYGAALLELGIKEEPGAVNYPWTIKKASTNEILPAGKSMLEIFQEVGMGRSVLILGAPGSGKTTMLLELARQWIKWARKYNTEPIPVVFNLVSWKERQTLADWLVEQFNLAYYVPKNLALSWVKGNKMLLLLDGLDEVKQSNRAKCVEAINLFRREHGLTSLVVCSRIDEYSGIQERLSFEGAITLQPLTSSQIHAYIDRFGDSLASIRLLLKKDRVWVELAELPLMLSIMILAYRERKVDDLIASGRFEIQREHLFDTYIARMLERPTRTSREAFSRGQTLHYLSWLARLMVKHDMVTYQIEAMQPSWLETPFQRSLYGNFVRLSQGLIHGLGIGLGTGLGIGLLMGQVDIPGSGVLGGCSVGIFATISIASILSSRREAMTERIQNLSPVKTADRVKVNIDGLLISGLGIGLAGGLAIGLLGGLNIESIGDFGVGLSLGLINGLNLGLGFILLSRQIGNLMGEIIMIDNLKWSWQKVRDIFIIALVFGLVGELGFRVVFGNRFGITYGPFFGGISMVSIGITAGLIFGLTGEQIEETTTPAQRLRQTLLNTVFVVMAIITSTGIVGALLVGMSVGLFSGLIVLLIVGLTGALNGGLTLGGTALLQHYSLRYVLTKYQLLPPHLIPFLDYAVDLIFLRRVGGSYIFVHRLLMEHFAEMDV